MPETLRLEGPSFASFPVHSDLSTLAADFAIVGVPIVTPYVRALPCTSATAPFAIRQDSQRYTRLSHYDFDFGGPLFNNKNVRCVDVGDVVRGVEGFLEHGKYVTSAIKKILDRRCVPISLGGDHATSIPIWRAYEGRGPIHIVQIDAHLDWRDDREGLKDGLSSPMRRAAEMPWISGMTQIGLRGQGSARQEEVDAARAYGKSQVVLAEELHEEGMKAIVARIPDAPNYYLTIDADGLDPSIAPGVTNPTPGGVTYYQVLHLMRGLAKKGKLVGADFVEVMPDIDIKGMTSLFGARMLLNFIGCAVHAGQVGNS